MKKVILIPVLIASFGASLFAGWFTTQDDHQREQHLEYQIQQERQHSDNLGAGIVVLSIGGVILLVVGTIIGSKARRSSNGH